MRRTILAVLILLVLARPAPAQREHFINIEGPDLKTRIDTAARQARSQQSSFWTAYAFDVRSGVAVDADLQDFHGSSDVISDTAVSIGTSHGVPVETHNLGVFLLHDASGASITRIEIYNLDRVREYSGYPVYWLGRAGNEESLNLLKGLVDSAEYTKLPERAVMAIGLHDDRRVAGMLKDIFHRSSIDKVRGAAVFWLGQTGGEQAFLADLLRNEQESVEIRKKAAFAIGASRDPAALSALEAAYTTVTPREIRRQIIFAVSINDGKDAAVDFLIKIATSDPDLELRKHAIFWLGQRAGERSLKVLGDTAGSDADTEVQKQALQAISRRSKDEAIPLLINIAKTHPKAEVRKQAMFWLGRTGDPRAVDFFKEVLKK